MDQVFRIAPGRPGSQILRHHCALWCAIAFPEFSAICAVISSEIKEAIKFRERIGITALSSGPDILHHKCAIWCAITLPKFLPK